MDSNQPVYLRTDLRRVEIKIDRSQLISFIDTKEYIAHEVVYTKDQTYYFRNLHF